MKYCVQVLKTIPAEEPEESEIGEGATVLLRCASKPTFKRLRRKYEEDKTYLIGDIEFLFAFDGLGLQENEKFYKP